MLFAHSGLLLETSQLAPNPWVILTCFDNRGTGSFATVFSSRDST
jgi:hypothetical protein